MRFIAAPRLKPSARPPANERLHYSRGLAIRITADRAPGLTSRWAVLTSAPVGTGKSLGLLPSAIRVYAQGAVTLHAERADAFQGESLFASQP